jgi:hypothetical protein
MIWQLLAISVVRLPASEVVGGELVLALRSEVHWRPVWAQSLGASSVVPWEAQPVNISMKSGESSGVQMTEERPILFTRDHGAIAVGVALFHRRMSPTSAAECFLRMGLSWWWESHSLERDSAARKERGWTQLKRETVPVFVGDLLERDVDSYNRFVALIGTDTEVRDEQLRAEMSAFDSGVESKILVIIVQVGDQDNELVFIRPPPPAPIRHLLRQTDVDLDTAKVHPYKRLGVLQLSSLFQLSE